MKKILVLILTIVLLSSLAVFVTACTKKTYELALITDIGTINDKSFNQGAWEGLEKYALENNITHKYYQPSAKTTDAYVAAIDLAVSNGAKVVVTPGYLFSNAIWIAQTQHPTVKFVLLDASPNNVTDWDTFATVDDSAPDFTNADNVISIFYAEEESGFLAGYAAVKEGFTKLGFMGGMAVPAVVRFGYGFVQGANYAAAEMNLADGAIALRYHYTGNFDQSPEAQAKAASWYTAGTEVIFACGGAVGNSVMAAAEGQTGKKVIGVDIDQSGESTTVITSALKMLSISVYDALTDFYADEFKGGQVVTLAADVDGVGLPADLTKFSNFNKAQYDAIFAKLVAKEITIVKDKDGETDVAVTSLVVPKVIVAVE